MRDRTAAKTPGKKVAALLVAFCAMLVMIVSSPSPAAADVQLTDGPTSDAGRFQSKSATFNRGGCKLHVSVQYYGNLSSGAGNVDTIVGANGDGGDCYWFRVRNINFVGGKYDRYATAYNFVYVTPGRTGTIIRNSNSRPYSTEICMRTKSDFWNMQCETFRW